MVVVTAAVIIGDKEQRLLPLGAGPQRLVDILQQPLPLGDILAGVV
eukprot:COSAG03_NODE_3249_length_2123_cov_16.794466_2_plen_46_part_00